MLKIVTVFWTCAALLLASVAARAEVKELAGVSVDVPEGWTLAESSGGNNLIGSSNIKVLAPENGTQVTISLFRITASGAEKLAIGTSERLEGTTPQARDGGYVFSFTLGGEVDGMSFVAGKGNLLACVTRVGRDPRLGDVLASLAGTRPEERELMDFMRPGINLLMP